MSWTSPLPGPIPTSQESRRIPPLLEVGPFGTGFLLTLGVGAGLLVLAVAGAFLLAILVAAGISLGS